MDLELTGKTAIVTGGTRGIGKAVAFELAREGVDVVVVGRDEETLRASAAEIAGETGRTITPLICDTSSTEQVDAMVEQAVATLGRIDLVVNAAAPAARTSLKLQAIDDDAFWSDVNVKLVGALRVIRAVAPHMAAAGGGRIVNVSGLNARSSANTVGSVRNVGLAALTKTLADELAPDGIRLVVVHPGVTRTEATPEKVAARAAADGTTHEKADRRMGSGNLLERMVTAQEVAYVVTFLLSPKAISIDGDAVAVGGGSPGSIHY